MYVAVQIEALGLILPDAADLPVYPQNPPRFSSEKQGIKKQIT